VTYNVEFSLEAAAELLRIAVVVGSAAAIRAADSIRRRLESDPEGYGNFLSEGLYYIDEEPIRAFFSSMRNQRLSRYPTSAFCDS